MTVKLDPSPRLKGLDFTRAAIALAAARGTPDDALRIAERRWGRGRAMDAIEKAAVGATTSTDWEAGPSSAAAEFVAAVGERSIVGRIPGLRRVGFYQRVITMADGTQASWVGEGQPVPLSRAALDFEELPTLKVAAMTVTTREAVDGTSRLAERALRDDLIRASVAAMDAAFIDGANAGVPDVRPAAVTNGADVAAGASGDFIMDMIAAFEGDLSTAVFVLHPKLAASLSGIERPNIGVRGGELAGVPALTSMHAPAGTAALLDPAGIAIAEAGGEIRTSHDATLEMSSEPSGGATEKVSMFQTGSIAIGVSMLANWLVIRSGAVIVSGTPAS